MAVVPISTVISAASTYDLTTLADVKDDLGITSTASDATLARMISAVSAAVANYCNTVFPVETVCDTFYPDRLSALYDIPTKVRPLILSRGPVVRTASSFATAGIISTGATLLSFTASISGAGIVKGSPVWGSYVPDGTAVVTVDTAAHSVTLTQGVSAAIAAGTTIFFGPRVTVTDTSGTETDLTLGTDYDIDPDTGFLIRLNSATGFPRMWSKYLTKIWYQAGYPTIPLDVADAAIRLVVGRFKARGRDPTIRSQDQPNVGNTTYWIGNPGGGGVFPEDIQGILDNYRVPAV